MAVCRETPKCPYCGRIIAKAILKDESDLPMIMQTVGDTFIGWKDKKCHCKGARKARKENSKRLKDKGGILGCLEELVAKKQKRINKK